MENIPLILAVGAVGLVVFWAVKKAMKLALYAGIAAVGLWIWFTQIN